MSRNLQSLLKEALLNNSYDYDDLHDSIKNVWQNSYSYLYYLQKAKIGYDEMHYLSNDEISRDNTRIGDLHLNKSLFATFDIDYDCIGYHREAYRTSKYYDKYFTYEDMIYNPQIFYKIPLVIIDNCVIYDFKIKIKSNSTEFVLPFKRSFVIEDKRNSDTDDIIYKDHKIQVIMIDNIYYQRYTKYHKHNLQYNYGEKSIKILKQRMIEETETQIITDVNKEYMSLYGVRYLSELSASQISKINKEIDRRIKIAEIPTKTGKFFLSLHFPNDNNKKYELGTQLIELHDDGDAFISYLPDNIASLVENTSNNIYVSIIFINELYSHTFYHGSQITRSTEDGADIIVVEDSNNKPYACPIPVENFMIFKKSINNQTQTWELMKNTEMIDMYYPNIYIINEDNMLAGDEYKVYYFYNKVPDLKYTCLFDFYFKFLKDIFNEKSMEEIINDIYYDRFEHEYTETQITTFKEIFNKILDYTTFHFKYGDMDFVCSYLKDSNNFDKVPIEYKDERFKKWIRESPWILRDYVKKQNDVGASYHLFVNTLNLESRLRNDTSQELGNTDMFEFNEPRYVFAFSNEREYPTMLDCRVFVDGLLVGDVYQRRKLFMDYFYIPESYIREDSYIELEVFPRYEYDEYFKLDSMDSVVNINIAEPSETISPTYSDLIIWEDTRKTEKTRIQNYNRYNFKRVMVTGGMITDRRFTTYEFQVSSSAIKIETEVGIDSNASENYSVISFYTENDSILRPSLNIDYTKTLHNSVGRYICDRNIPNGTRKIRVTTLTNLIETPTIFVYNELPDDGEVKQHFDVSEFKVVSKYSRGNFEVSSDDENKPVKFTRLSSFSISAASSDAVGKRFKLAFRKVPIMIRFTIDRPGYIYVDTKVDGFCYSNEYIRVFRNGRLIPKVKYRLLTGYKTPRLLFMEWFNVGDIVYIDITPYRYTQIYHKKNITKRDTLIDLRGIINKPFDISYYDVYLNGRKLSLNNVFAITPWLITLVNIKSNYNLDIYEKERDWEYFGIDYSDTDYYFSFDELANSGIVDDEEYCKLIKDRIDELKDPRLIIKPNEFIEDPLDYEDGDIKYPLFYTFYYDELIPKTYVNPSENQFNKNFMNDNYKEIMDMYYTHPKDYSRNEYENERKERYGPVLLLDPDLTVESVINKNTPIYLQFKDKEFDDVKYLVNGELRDNDIYDDGDSSFIDDTVHYCDGRNIINEVRDGLYEDAEDQPAIPDGNAHLRFRDVSDDDKCYYDENGNLVLDTDRSSSGNDDPSYNHDSIIYSDGRNIINEVGDGLYEDEEDQPDIPDGNAHLRFRDRPGNDGYHYDLYGRLILDTDRNPYSGHNSQLVLDVERDSSINGVMKDENISMSGSRLIYGINDNLYEDEEDQPPIPDGTAYLRFKDREFDDGWYYDEYGHLILDTDRTNCIGGSELVYSLDGQVYEDENTILSLKGSVITYDVGHTDDVPDEYLRMNVEIGNEENIIN